MNGGECKEPLGFSTGVVLRVALCGQDCRRRGEGGAEESGRAGGEEEELESSTFFFCLDTNLTTVKERRNFSGSFFFCFNEWSLPPAKTTCSPLQPLRCNLSPFLGG